MGMVVTNLGPYGLDAVEFTGEYSTDADIQRVCNAIGDIFARALAEGKVDLEKLDVLLKEEELEEEQFAQECEQQEAWEAHLLAKSAV